MQDRRHITKQNALTFNPISQTGALVVQRQLLVVHVVAGRIIGRRTAGVRHDGVEVAGGSVGFAVAFEGADFEVMLRESSVLVLTI